MRFLLKPTQFRLRIARTLAKHRFVLVLVFIGSLSSFAVLRASAQTDPVLPDSRLPGLLRERAVLTRRYAAASAQRHSLFGNKPSKKDLQEVVDALQGIVDKDQQIVDLLNETARKAQSTSARLAATTTTLESTGRDDRNLTAERLAELQNENENLQQRAKQQLARQRDLQADVSYARQSQLVRDGLIAFLTVLSIGLMVALWRRK